MKKVIVAVVAIVAAWLVVSLTVSGAKKSAAASEWPMGLGRLDSVPKRYPRQEANDAARELERLAKANDVAALRAHLLGAGPLVWSSDLARGTAPDMKMLTGVGKLLSADAKATGNWDDLRAQWALAKSLWERPDFVSSMIALTITRELVDAAAVLPPPAPGWYEELLTFDYRRSMLAAMQADTWRMSRAMTEHAASAGTLGPYWRISRVDYVAYERRKAWALARGGTPAEAPAWWNRPANMLAPHIDPSWARLAKLEADLHRGK